MKKIKLISFILIAVIVLLCLVELFCNYQYKKCLKEVHGFSLSGFFMPYYKVIPFIPENEFHQDEDFIYNGDKNKGAISILGCSATFGIDLKKEETFAGQLNKLTDRTVYARARVARGLAYVYYQVLHKLVPDDTEYLIYVYLPFHKISLYDGYADIFEHTTTILNYFAINDQLIQLKIPNFLNNLYSIQSFREYYERKIHDEVYKNPLLYGKVLKETVKQFKKNYPKSKFVLLKLQVLENENTELPLELEQFLINEGCIIIDSKKLTGEDFYLEKYRLETDKMHPSALVWKVLTPKIVEALNL